MHPRPADGLLKYKSAAIATMLRRHSIGLFDVISARSELVGLRLRKQPNVALRGQGTKPLAAIATMLRRHSVFIIRTYK